MSFGKYLTFLGLFCGPITLAFVMKDIKTSVKSLKVFSIVIGSALVGWLVLSNRVIGEMDFGGGFPFDTFTKRVIETFGFVFGIVFCAFAINRFRAGDRLTRYLLVGLFPYLILISSSRPTQRYLIFAIPVALLLLVDSSSVLSINMRRLTFGVTALGFAAVSLLGMSYLRAQGNAAENMAVWMEKNGVINQSSGGMLGVHAGQHFYGITQTEVKYQVVETTSDGEKLITERILHREAMNVLGKITRVYVLRELPKAP